MTKKIFKYGPLRIESPFLKIESPFLKMPRFAQILSVQFQGNAGIMVWAEVDPSQPEETRYFEVYCAGASLPEDGYFREYLDTLLLDGGSFVIHIYERISIVGIIGCVAENGE